MLQSANAAIDASRQRARALRTQDREQAAKIAARVASAPAAPRATITSAATTFVGSHR